MPEQPYHHGDLKAQLIEQGLQLLDAQGYERFSLREAAKRCGVSQTAPYRHFRNKDDLIGAIAAQAMSAFERRLLDAVALHPGAPAAQLTAMGVAYIRFFAEKPEYLRLLFLTDLRIRERFFQDERVRKHGGTLGILKDAVTRYREACPQDPRSHEEIVLHCWGVVHGISVLIASGELQNTKATLAQAEAVIRGLL